MNSKLEKAETIQEMRAEIFRQGYYDPIVRRGLDSAMVQGLSGEDTMTLIAYHLLASLIETRKCAIELSNLMPTKPIVTIDD